MRLPESNRGEPFAQKRRCGAPVEFTAPFAEEIILLVPFSFLFPRRESGGVLHGEPGGRFTRLLTGENDRVIAVPCVSGDGCSGPHRDAGRLPVPGESVLRPIDIISIDG